MNELKIAFNKDSGLWELIEIKTGEVLDKDANLDELKTSYNTAMVILPRGNV